LGQSTVAIFLAAHLLKNLQLIETARVSLLKTVYLLSPLTSDSTLHMLAGRAQQPMPAFTRPPVRGVSCLYPRAGTTSRMLDTHSATNFLPLIVESATILLSGDVRTCGVYLQFSLVSLH
jgi:hypothetical protein